MIRKYFRGLTKNTFLLTLTSFFGDISTEMLYPVLPIFLTSVLSAPATVVGLIEGFAVAGQNIIQVFSGGLADKIQSNKKVALFGYAVAAISKFSIGFATIWPQVMLGRVADRLGTGTRSAPRDGLIASSVEPEYRGKAFGIEGIGDNLGAFVGPLIAVLFIFFLKVDLHSIFFLAIIPGSLAFIMMLLVTEPKSQVKADMPKFNLQSFPVDFWKYLLAIGIMGVGNSANAFLILRAKNIGISLETTILIYAAFNLMASISSFPAGTLSDRLGRRNILVVSILIFIITYLGFALSTNYILIGFLFIFYGIYMGIFRAVGKAMATDLSPVHLRSTGLGLFSTVIGLTALIASLVGGILWDKINPSATFYFGAASAILGILALLILTKNKH